MATTSGGTTPSRLRCGRAGRAASGPTSAAAIASGVTRGRPLMTIAAIVPRLIMDRTVAVLHRHRRANSRGVRLSSSTSHLGFKSWHVFECDEFGKIRGRKVDFAPD
jgi:hypothetical protein